MQPTQQSKPVEDGHVRKLKWWYAVLVILGLLLLSELGNRLPLDTRPSPAHPTNVEVIRMGDGECLRIGDGHPVCGSDSVRKAIQRQRVNVEMRR